MTTLGHRIFALIAAAGCQASSMPEDPPSKRFERDMMLRFHMHENFGLLRGIERLLLRGDLENAKLFASGMAEAPDEPGLGAWTKHAVVVRERAAALAQARTVGEACARVARLADACAGCHDAAGVSPEFRPSIEAPPDEATIEARMARHLWATDRMWEGMVGSSEESWRAGLDVLAATPLPEAVDSDQRRAYALQLRQTADRLRLRRTTDTRGERVKEYGDILAICAGCHAAPRQSQP
jgi:cytochrome c553